MSKLCNQETSEFFPTNPVALLSWFLLMSSSTTSKASRDPVDEPEEKLSLWPGLGERFLFFASGYMLIR